MATVKETFGAESFFKALEEVKKPVVYFTASKKDDGVPWCPDCAAADPIVLESLNGLPADEFVLIARIDRPYWKESPGPDNALKKQHGIKCLPTLMRWGNAEMLGEDECKDKGKVSEFLTSKPM